MNKSKLNNMTRSGNVSGFYILSTPNGLVTHFESLNLDENLGGEGLMKVVLEFFFVFMILCSNKVNLNSDIDFCFSPSGCVYISGRLGTISNKLSFSFDLISNSSKRSFNNSSIKQLFSLIKFNVFSVTLGYYVFIDLIGLGYKIKKVTTLLYRFYLGQAHYVYVYLPSDVFF